MVAITQKMAMEHLMSQFWRQMEMLFPLQALLITGRSV